jgi:hypothetical protein
VCPPVEVGQTTASAAAFTTDLYGDAGADTSGGSEEKVVAVNVAQNGDFIFVLDHPAGVRVSPSLGQVSIERCRVLTGPTDGPALRISGCLGVSVVETTVRGGGNVAVQALDPRFVSMLGPDGVSGTLVDDYRLGVGSPYVDAGDTTAVPPSLTLDLGAHER